MNVHRRWADHRAAFTLVEMVVSTAVLGFVGAVSAQLLFEGLRDYHRVVDRKETLDAVRLAMERMIREVRQIAHSEGDDQVPSIISASANQVEFDRIEGDSTVRVILRLYDPGGGLPKQVQLCIGSVANAYKLLESMGVNLTFTYYKGDGTTTSDLAQIRRIGITIQMPVATSDPGYTSPDVTLTSSSYIRNLIGEASDA